MSNLSGSSQNEEHPREQLRKLCLSRNLELKSLEFADLMDELDPLASFRRKFDYPKKFTLPHVDTSLIKDQSEECLYFCGNSLGLKPLSTDRLINEQLTKWGNNGAELYFLEPYPTVKCDTYGRESLGRLLGAEPDCVSLMNALTVNLHLLFISFYQPTQDRFKILIEKDAFPSDRYAMRSQALMRGFDPQESVLEVGPREGEDAIRHEDIIELIEKEGHQIAVICLSGVQYFTGQKFDMESITAVGHEHGCMVGWDLAHAIGNVEVKLDEWNVDFACWCTYKYLNAGPGCIGGAYVNRKYNNGQSNQLHGWWSNKNETRFFMEDHCDLASGVDSFKLSNPSPWLVCSVLASLEIFDDAGMPRLLTKQRLLTGYLEVLLDESFKNASFGTSIRILTPRDLQQRGCQLSVEFSTPLEAIHKELQRRGVVCDIRQSTVMRIAPVPLYNSFKDVYRFVETLIEVLQQ